MIHIASHLSRSHCRVAASKSKVLQSWCYSQGTSEWLDKVCQIWVGRVGPHPSLPDVANSASLLLLCSISQQLLHLSWTVLCLVTQEFKSLRIIGSPLPQPFPSQLPYLSHSSLCLKLWKFFCHFSVLYCCRMWWLQWQYLLQCLAIVFIIYIIVMVFFITDLL